MTREAIYNALIEEGYTHHSAEVTAVDLSNIHDLEIRQALLRWLDDGEKTNIIRDNFSCAQLMACHGLKYPAALIFLEWYGEDAPSALASLSCGGG